MCTEEGIVQELRDRKQFVKPSEVKRKAKDAGRKRWLRKTSSIRVELKREQCSPFHNNI